MGTTSTQPTCQTQPRDLWREDLSRPRSTGCCPEAKKKQGEKGILEGETGGPSEGQPLRSRLHSQPEPAVHQRLPLEGGEDGGKQQGARRAFAAGCCCCCGCYNLKFTEYSNLAAAAAAEKPPGPKSLVCCCCCRRAERSCRSCLCVSLRRYRYIHTRVHMYTYACVLVSYSYSLQERP